MNLLKIFKKYKLVILVVIFLYFLRYNMENLTTIEQKYNSIISTICHSVSNKDSCVENYKNKCREDACRGMNGDSLKSCKNSCTNISL